MRELLNHLHLFQIEACRQINETNTECPLLCWPSSRNNPCPEIFGSFFRHFFPPRFAYFLLQLHHFFGDSLKTTNRELPKSSQQRFLKLFNYFYKEILMMTKQTAGKRGKKWCDFLACLSKQMPHNEEVSVISQTFKAGFCKITLWFCVKVLLTALQMWLRQNLLPYLVPPLKFTPLLCRSTQLVFQHHLSKQGVGQRHFGGGQRTRRTTSSYLLFTAGIQHLA